MKKVYNESQLVKLNSIPVEVIEFVRELIVILNEAYGEDRNVESDLGGYVLIAENIVDIEILKQDKLQCLVPEYTDVIEVIWSSFFKELGIKYDENMRIIIVKNNDKLRRI